MHICFRFVGALVAATTVSAGYCFLQARRDPVVRHATVALPDWPSDAEPVKLVLISDIHMGGAAMGRRRLDRIVAQINALDPDVVLMAGDYISGNKPRTARRLGRSMVAPLSRLHSRLGTVAVLGNHDWHTGVAAVRTQFSRAGVRLLENEAVTLGPLALGGLGDSPTGHDDLAETAGAVRALPGANVLFGHSPDIAPHLPGDMPLLLAGHTHCGQVVLPFYGPLASVTRYGERYRCGVRREGARTVIVTAGLGTSGGPFRFGAPPDLWLVTLGPTAGSQRAALSQARRLV